MTYFFMLLFVFITLFAIALRWLHTAQKTLRLNLMILSLLWAALGTFFFHNIW